MSEVSSLMIFKRPLASGTTSLKSMHETTPHPYMGFGFILETSCTNTHVSVYSRAICTTLSKSAWAPVAGSLQTYSTSSPSNTTTPPCWKAWSCLGGIQSSCFVHLFITCFRSSILPDLISSQIAYGVSLLKNVARIDFFIPRQGYMLDVGSASSLSAENPVRSQNSNPLSFVPMEPKYIPTLFASSRGLTSLSSCTANCQQNGHPMLLPRNRTLLLVDDKRFVTGDTISWVDTRYTGSACDRAW